MKAYSRLYRQPTVTAVALPHRKRKIRQAYLDRVEATMDGPLDGATPMLSGVIYRGVYYHVNEAKHRIDDLRSWRDHRGLNIIEERALMAMERAYSASMDLRRRKAMGEETKS